MQDFHYRYNESPTWESAIPFRRSSHFYNLVPSLRMRGVTHPLLQYAFMTWCLIKQETRLHIASRLRRSLK